MNFVYTPQLVMQAFYDKIQECLKVQDSLKEERLYSAKEILNTYWETKTLFKSNDDEAKNVLWNLVCKGYVETKLKTKTDYNGSVRKKVKPFTIRVWKLTDKGLNQMRKMTNS